MPAAIAQAMPGWQRVAHHGTHHLMYLLFFAVPLLGWAYSSAKGFPIVWFGVLPLPDWVAPDPALAELLKPLHGLAAWGLIGLVTLHRHCFLGRQTLQHCAARRHRQRHGRLPNMTRHVRRHRLICLFRSGELMSR